MDKDILKILNESWDDLDLIIITPDTFIEDDIENYFKPMMKNTHEEYNDSEINCMVDCLVKGLKNNIITKLEIHPKLLYFYVNTTEGIYDAHDMEVLMPDIEEALEDNKEYFDESKHRRNEVVERIEGEFYYDDQEQDLDVLVEILDRMERNYKKLRKELHTIVSNSKLNPDYFYVIKFKPGSTDPKPPRLSYSKMYTALRDKILEYSNSTDEDLKELVEFANTLNILTTSNPTPASWNYQNKHKTNIHGKGNLS